MIVASGILFVTKDNKALFLKRGPGGDCPGLWAFPGGKQEDFDKDLEACAIREAKEELGSFPQGKLAKLARRVANREVAGQTGTIVGKLPVPAAIQAAAANTPPGDAVVVPEEQTDFTTYLQYVDDEFPVKIDGEHVAWTWAPLTQPPEPLHPGARTALARFAADEMQVMEMIRDNELTSPQFFENHWLFAIRVTGTGMAYRREKHDDAGNVTQEAEYVWRDPSIYLNDDFLRRCQGLPVVADHPEGQMLDGAEFAERSVGAIALPYIQGDEVWGVARIYDPTVAKFMEENPSSTSPGVVFRDASKTNVTVTTDEGENILIEGKPSLLDHLAVCKRGVWDKGGKPTGVRSEGVSSMTEEEKQALREKIRAEERAAARKDADEAMMDKAKKDADEDRQNKIDKLCDSVETGMKGMCDRFDSFEKRLDAVEKNKGEVVADKKDEDKDEDTKGKSDEDKDEEKKSDKKDEDKEEKKEEKMDSKKDSDISILRAELDTLKARIQPTQLTDDDHDKLASAQARADSVFSFFGKRAPRPLDGESVLGYRKRLARELQPHSETIKGIDLAMINDTAVFEPIERMIYNDAEKAGVSPATVPAGTLRERRIRTDSGHDKREFIGEPKAWLSNFSHGRRRVRLFNHKAA